jgi:hypothetical protein
VFDVWTSFVVATENVSAFTPVLPASASTSEHEWSRRGRELIRTGKDLISYIVRARVPMPKSTREFVERCMCYRASWSTSKLPLDASVTDGAAASSSPKGRLSGAETTANVTVAH